MARRMLLLTLLCSGLALLTVPPAFAGCGELCGFMDCAAYPDPEVGCIERTFGCLDMLCYAASPAACATAAEDLEERVDQALEGVDLQDREAVAAALEDLGTPVRYKIAGEVIYETPNFELERQALELKRSGAAGQVAELEASDEN